MLHSRNLFSTGPKRTLAEKSVPAEKPTAPSRRLLPAPRSILLFAFYLFVAVALQIYFRAYVSELGGYPDEPGHFVTGTMLREYLKVFWHGVPPLRFAENYYLHYPKVGFGHWPPLYYILQTLWSTVAGPSISAIIALQAFLVVQLAFVSYSAFCKFLTPVAGMLLGLMLLLSRAMQESAGQVMGEPLLALCSLVAIVCLVSYFETADTFRLGWFAVWTVLATSTKGSGLALLGAPLLMALILWRIDLLRRASFWLMHLALGAALLPWHIFTWKMVSNGMQPEGLTLPVVLRQMWTALAIAPELMGPLFLFLALLGMLEVARRAMRRAADPWGVAMLSLVALTYAFHTIAPNGIEARRLLMAYAGFLGLAGIGAARVARFSFLRQFSAYRTELVIAAAILLSAPWFVNVARKHIVGYREVAAELNAMPETRDSAILASTHAEGMLISELAAVAPQPSIYVVRSSKFLADSDWDRNDFTLRFADVSMLQRVFDAVPISRIIIDRFDKLPVEAEVLQIKQLLKEHSEDWRLARTWPAVDSISGEPGEIKMYERVNLANPHLKSLSVDLRRMIGRDVSH